MQKKECDVESRYKKFWIVKHVGKQKVTFVQAKQNGMVDERYIKHRLSSEWVYTKLSKLQEGKSKAKLFR